jgi:hypothetical protein
MNASEPKSETATESLPDPAGFHTDAVNGTAVEADWTRGYGTEWDYWSALVCDECGELVVSTGPESDHRHEVLFEGPMMSCYYPIEERCLGGPEDAARKIAGLPLCVVRVGDQYGLALTGGGMDLSWEIAEAFMRLGHAPPLRYSNLPGIAGRGSSARDRWIVEGCLRSAKAAAVQADAVRASLLMIRAEAGTVP